MVFFIELNLITLIAFLTTFLVSLYFYLTRNYKYWSSLGIDGPKPIVFLGNFYQSFFKTTTEVLESNTKRYGTIHGIYFGSRPILVVAEPELIKTMNIKDFHIFVDRNDIKTGDPLNDRQLFNLFGDEWKKMKSIVSPTFSIAKVRNMHPLIERCVERVENYLFKKAKDINNEIELKQLMGNLAMDAIASCAFGIQIDIHNEHNNQFVKNAQKVFRGNWRIWVFYVLKTTFPKVLDIIQLKIIPPSVSHFFQSSIKAMLSRRKTETNKYNDYLQIMINANKGVDNEVQEEDCDNHKRLGKSDDINSTGSKTNVAKTLISEEDIIATSLLFFAAGIDTTSSFLSFLFYTLAIEQDIQQKLYEEILSYSGNFDYDSIAKMPYLEACIAETLRLYNPVPFITRLASEDYKLGDTGIAIPKGMLVFFDIQSIHRNPKYYPNPTQFKPERFLPENRDRLTPYTYLPFGIGPRSCVGMKFALMEAKTAIVHLVHKFKFVRTTNTQIPLKFKKLELLLFSRNNINIGIELRL